MQARRKKKIKSDDDWFKEVFGIRESLNEIDRFISICEDDGKVVLKDKNGNNYYSGVFSIRDISSFHNLSNRGNGTFSIVKYEEIISDKEKIFSSFGMLQSFKEFCGATFQLETQFNCLNFISKEQTAGNGISCYVYDNQNSTIASLGTSASLLYRNYFVESKGQIGDEIDLLDKTPINVIHGFPIIQENDITKIKDKIDWNDLDNYKVGTQQYCQVILSPNEDGFSFVKYPQYVNHVFVSSFSFQDNVIKDRFTYLIAENLLEAEYKLTILSSWENSILYQDLIGSKICFLTFIGCSFQLNPIQIVINSILSLENLISQSGLNVFLFINKYNFYNSISQLSSIVEKTNGKIINNINDFYRLFNLPID